VFDDDVVHIEPGHRHDTLTYLEVCLDYKGTQEERSRRHILSKNNRFNFTMFLFETTYISTFASSSDFVHTRQKRNLATYLFLSEKA
jgi:hypothetical protein